MPRLQASGQRSLPLSRRLALPIGRVKALLASVGVLQQAMACRLPGGRRANDPADPQTANPSGSAGVRESRQPRSRCTIDDLPACSARPVSVQALAAASLDLSDLAQISGPRQTRKGDRAAAPARPSRVSLWVAG